MNAEREPSWERTVISKGDVLYTSTVRPAVQAEINRRTSKVRFGTTFINLSVLDFIRVRMSQILHPGKTVRF